MARAGRGSPACHVGVLGCSVVGVEARELREAWLNRALDNAGIYRATWRPTLGVEENRRTVEAVYAYDGRLFVDHPYLEWAGMANMVGPAFYAGFRDLGFLRAPGEERRTPCSGGPRGTWPGAPRATSVSTRRHSTMQKKIFEDQATMHEAYVADGLPQIEEITTRGSSTRPRSRPGGRSTPAAATRRVVDSGNRTLLFREQFDIIDRFYPVCLPTGRWAGRSRTC